MMKTKAIVPMVLLSCVLFFSGCTKEVYLPCKAEEPIRTVQPVCGGLESDFEFGKCASIKYQTLEKDYDVLMARFRSCK